MLVMIEISKEAGWTWKPWIFKSRITTRVGWGCFALDWIKIPYMEYVFTPKDFVFTDGTRVTSFEKWQEYQIKQQESKNATS